LSKLIVFNKPYDVLCQFTDSENRKTLADYIPVPDVYAAGRLDKDSEGLVLLTGDGKLQSRISHPKHKLWKTYWVQVEGIPDEPAINKLIQGVQLKDGRTKPARAALMESSDELWDREPPIRFRKNVTDSWLALSIREGKNRQIRRMTAAVGFPTLRLIRYSIGNMTIKNLAPGEWCEVSSEELKLF